MLLPLVGEMASNGPGELNVLMAAWSAPVFGSPSKFCEYAAPVKLSVDADNIARCSSNSTRGLNPHPEQLLHGGADWRRLDFRER